MPKFSSASISLRGEDITQTASDASQEVPPSTKTKSSSNTDAWEKLFTAMTEYDSQMIDRWKSEMDNLLIFTGLFSAVVGAFTIESYAMLQEDPTQTSAQLLAQISAQLSSFSVNSGFINSSAPAVPVTPFQAPGLAVRINIFWFLSLAISLVAALFAIVVQQWLREYPLNHVRSALDGVKLRQFRYGALNRWGVPMIIGILPVLLQISLVLFLVGLFNLIYTLNRTVFLALVITSGIPLLILIITPAMHVLSTSCPYKSSLAKVAVWLVFLVVSIPAYALMGIATVGYTILAIPTGIVSEFSNNKIPLTYALARYLKQPFEITANRISIFMVARFRSTLDWNARDVSATEKAKNLELYALEWAPAVIPSHDIPTIAPCLSDLRPEDRATCATTWVAKVLNLRLEFSTYDHVDPSSHPLPFGPEGLHFHLALLLDNLPNNLEYFDKVGVQMLLLGRYLMTADSAPKGALQRQYIESLVNLLPKHEDGIRSGNGDVNIGKHKLALQVITASLLAGLVKWDYQLDKPETAALCRVLTSLCESCLDPGRLSAWFSRHDIYMCSCASALYALSKQPQTIMECPETIDSLLDTLISFARLERPRIRSHSGPTQYQKTMDQDNPTPVWRILCDSLLSLATHGGIGFSEPRLGPVVDSLIQVFEDNHFHVFDGPVDALHRTKELLGVSRSSPVSDHGMAETRPDLRGAVGSLGEEGLSLVV